jgi:hypothetical protein
MKKPGGKPPGFRVFRRFIEVCTLNGNGLGPVEKSRHLKY